jgi:hypothetical protein
METQDSNFVYSFLVGTFTSLGLALFIFRNKRRDGEIHPVNRNETDSRESIEYNIQDQDEPSRPKG